MPIQYKIVRPWSLQKAPSISVTKMEKCNAKEVISNTALFGKVYRMIFHSNRGRLVVKTGVIMYIRNSNYKNYSKIFLSIYLHIFIFCYKFKT